METGALAMTNAKSLTQNKGTTMKALILVLLPFIAHAAPVKTEQGEARFLAVGYPSAMRIAGKTITPAGKLDLVDAGVETIVSGELRIPLKDLETGIALRDTHMKEKYLEIERFPEAVLTFVKQKFPKKGEPVAFEAELFLHGVRQKVNGTGSLVDGRVKASFGLKLQDFAITTPSFAGIKVSEDVSVDAEFGVKSN